MSPKLLWWEERDLVLSHFLQRTGFPQKNSALLTWKEKDKYNKLLHVQLLRAALRLSCNNIMFSLPGVHSLYQTFGFVWASKPLFCFDFWRTSPLTPYLSMWIEHICAMLVEVIMGKCYCHCGLIKYGLVHVDIWKSGLWLQITNIISSTHTSENEQLGNQESQLLVAWNFTCHLFFMRKHEKMFISVQILCKNLRGKEETVPVLKHLQSWNICLKFLKKITMS